MSAVMVTVLSHQLSPNLTAAVIAYGVSALSPTMDVANTAVPALLSLLLFLSGSCVRVAQIPVYLRWVAHINVLRYSFGGLMINQFQGLKGKAYFGEWWVSIGADHIAS